MTGGGEVASAGEATGRRPAMVLEARGAQIGERGRGLDRGIVREGIRVSGGVGWPIGQGAAGWAMAQLGQGVQWGGLFCFSLVFC